MPTNEERREVAENLRDMTMRGCRYAEQFYELLQETVMREWDFHSFGDVADRLADLIEPEPERTCRFRNDGHGILWCDAEGCDYDMDDYLPIPNYCPNCGARVVEEEHVGVTGTKEISDGG